MATDQKNDNNNQNLLSVPRFRVNLDDPPNKRWTKIVEKYKDSFKQIEKIITELIKQELGQTGLFLKSLVSSMISTLTKCGAVYYKDELKAISNQCGMSLGLLTLMQLIYEASAHCTSIVCIDKNGRPIHIRTMDWEMAFLRPLTIEIEFYRNNKPICIATSWAGYVGILTGMRYGNKGFSVSVNFRVIGDSFWQNLKKAMSGSWPIGFLVREVLTDVNATNYQNAQRLLTNSKLISPVYFILSGYNKNEGTLITRNRENDIKCLNLNDNVVKTYDDIYGDNQDTDIYTDNNNNNHDNDNKNNSIERRSYLVQTNIDHWSCFWADNIMWSIQRRRVASEELDKINGTLTYNNLWNLVNLHPLFNEITVYGTLMSVFDGYFETRIPHKEYGFDKDAVQDNIDNDNDNDDEWLTCIFCANKYHESLNAIGECKHIGSWHSTFSDCNKMKCAYGLGTNIGHQHWSCCFQIVYRSKCKKSGKHSPMPKKPKKLGLSKFDLIDDDDDNDNDDNDNDNQ